MNNDLISREALKAEVALMFGDNTHITESVCNIIDNAPTVEPHYVSDLPDDVVKTLQTLAIDYSDGIAIFERKRPQGEWIIVSRNCWKCPYCQELTNEGKKFCPNCGAQMIGGSA